MGPNGPRSVMPDRQMFDGEPRPGSAGVAALAAAGTAATSAAVATSAAATRLGAFIICALLDLRLCAQLIVALQELLGACSIARSGLCHATSDCEPPPRPGRRIGKPVTRSGSVAAR